MTYLDYRSQQESLSLSVPLFLNEKKNIENNKSRRNSLKVNQCFYLLVKLSNAPPLIFYNLKDFTISL